MKISGVADFLLEFAILGHETLADVPNLIHPQVIKFQGIFTSNMPLRDTLMLLLCLPPTPTLPSTPFYSN